MQCRAAHTETRKAACSPGHLELPEANRSPADRHSRALARGDLSGSRERTQRGKREKKEEREKEWDEEKRKREIGGV